jgi:hypothetical protein
LPVQQRLSLVSYACAKRAVAKAVPWESPKFVETMHTLRCKRCRLKLELAY